MTEEIDRKPDIDVVCEALREASQALNRAYIWADDFRSLKDDLSELKEALAYARGEADAVRYPHRNEAM